MNIILLGLVDRLVPVRRNVHRPHIARTDDPRICQRRLAGPHAVHFPLDDRFGNTAIALDLGGNADIAATVANNLPVALFETLEQLPLALIVSGVATLLIITLFFTSAVSGALVIDMITSGAAQNPPVWQRAFWAVLAGTVAALLLVAGGLQALQTAAIASALPFAIVMVFICYGLLRALQLEGKQAMDLSQVGADPIADPVSWQQRLAAITDFHNKTEIEAFLETVARPALAAVMTQLPANSLEPFLTSEPHKVELRISHGDRGELRYSVRSRWFRAASFAWAEPRKATEREPFHYRAMVYASIDEQPHDVTGHSVDPLINDLLTRYARFRHQRRIS